MRISFPRKLDPRIRGDDVLFNFDDVLFNFEVWLLLFTTFFFTCPSKTAAGGRRRMQVLAFSTR